MNDPIGTYLYDPSIILETFLGIAVFASFFRPRFLTPLAAVVLLVRPNERMALHLPYITLVSAGMLVQVLLHLKSATRQSFSRHNKYLMFFVALVGVQSVFIYRDELSYNLVYISSGLLLYICATTFLDDDRGMAMMSRAIILSCFIICFEPVYYHYTETTGSALWHVFHIEKSNRLQAWGMWANPNETAFIACLALANLTFITSRFKSRWHYIASGALIPFFALVVFLTASRAGFAALLLIFLPTVFLIRRRSLKAITILFLAGIVLLSQTLTPKRTDTEGSTEERTELRVKGEHLALEFPIVGVGFNRARYEMGSRPVHNIYVQAFAETGFTGGLLLLAYLYLMGTSLYRRFKTLRADGAYYLVFLGGLYCSSVFYFFWGNQLLSTLFFVVMAELSATICCTTAPDAASEQGVSSCQPVR